LRCRNFSTDGSPTNTCFVIAHSAPGGDRFSQFRVGLHHLSFRATSREEVDSFAAMLKEIGAKIIHPADLARIRFGAMRGSRRHPHRDKLHSAGRMGHGRRGEQIHS